MRVSRCRLRLFVVICCSWSDGHFIAKSLQAVDEIALEAFGRLAIKVIPSEFFVFLVIFENMVNHCQERMPWV